MTLRSAMHDTVAPFLRPGEPVQAVFAAQTASPLLAGLNGVFVFLAFNRYRIVAVTPARILVLDTGKAGIKTARGLVTELPRSTRLGPATGLWYQIPAGKETLRVHRRFFKDIETADRSPAAAA
ncbi:MAG: hypothetical protein ACRDOB_03375 [Streptosporangiaceae bacterium]